MIAVQSVDSSPVSSDPDNPLQASADSFARSVDGASGPLQTGELVRYVWVCGIRCKRGIGNWIYRLLMKIRKKYISHLKLFFQSIVI